MPIKSNAKLIIALFCVAFFWGTTFLAIRIGVQTIPPILVTGLRNLIAGIILLIYLGFSKQFEKMDWPRVKRNTIMSFMMIVLSNGLTTFAEKYITSGLASLISTLSPLCVLVLNLSLGLEKPSFKILTGILLGVGGIYLIYQNSLADLFNPDYRLGIAAILLAVLIWSTGTIYSKKISDHPGNMLVNLCFQMLFAGFFMLIAQFIIQPDIHYHQWSTPSILSVIYLALFGSLVGYASYLYALSKISSTKVSVFTYINAVVALALGWFILHEEITLKIILAAILIIGGVIVANYHKAPHLSAKK